MNSNHCACSRASPGSRHALSFFLPSRLPSVLLRTLFTLLVTERLLSGRMKHHVAYGDRGHTTRGAKMTPFFFDSQPCLAFHARTHHVTRYRDMKWILKCGWTTRSFKVQQRFIRVFLASTSNALSLLLCRRWKKKRGRIFLTARHLRKVPWNQSPAAALRFRGDAASSCATQTQQALCKLRPVSVVSIPPLGYRAGNGAEQSESSLDCKMKFGRWFSNASAKTRGKTIQIHFTVFDLLALHCCLSVILWVWWSELLHHMVSCWPGHAASPYWKTGSAGVWCLTCLTCLLLEMLASSSIMH